MTWLLEQRTEELRWDEYPDHRTEWTPVDDPQKYAESAKLVADTFAEPLAWTFRHGQWTAEVLIQRKLSTFTTYYRIREIA